MEDEGPDLLHEAAWQVYAVPPEEFVSTRAAWVKRLRSEGHRELAKTVGALHKPSVSAGAVNALVRAGDPVVERLRDVGEQLRHAQSALDAAGLATLRGERDDVLAAWVDAARTHAVGGALTAAVEGEVRSTAVAALADAGATEVVLSGTLTRALAYSGFGEVDVADAVARTSTGVVLTRIEGGRSQGSGATGGEEVGERVGEEVVSEEVIGEGVGEGVADEAAEGPTLAPDSADIASESGPLGTDLEAKVAYEADGRGGWASAEANGEGGGAYGEAKVVDEAHEVAEDALDRLRAALDQADAEVSEARSRRRDAAGAEKRTSTGLTVAERGLEQARRLLAQAERHRAEATEAQDEAAAELAEADAALTEARERRDTAREALEEAEDA